MLQFATYRNVKIFLTCLLLLSLSFFIYVISTEGKGSHSTDSFRYMDTVSNEAQLRFVPTVVNNARLNYGIVVDCGSSGSRLFVYFWPPHDGHTQEMLNIQQMRSEEGPVVMKVEPGLSHYADMPSQASEYLAPLLDYAAMHIPREKHKETPLYIMATAGLRMLPESQQSHLLDDLRVDIAVRYDFLFTDTQVEVITGREEGIYAWISINYALNKFDHSVGDDEMIEIHESGEEEYAFRHLRKRTVGMLDMGGGSVQIAYEVPKSLHLDPLINKELVSKAQLAEFNLGCTDSDVDHSYRVYVATFLGYGGNVARKRYEELLVRRQVSILPSNTSDETGNDPIEDPCLPANMADSVTVDHQEFMIRGTGSFEHCMDLQYPLLNQTAPCHRQPCSLSGIYQPPIDYPHSEFYGFSEFFYSMDDVLGVAGSYRLSTFRKTAQEFCGTDWNILKDRYRKGLYPKADEARLRLQCFKSAWIASMLNSGFHFPDDYRHFTSTQLVRGQEVQWTLGALVYKTRYFPLREMEKWARWPQQSESWPTSNAYSILLLCLVPFIALLLLLCLRRKRRFGQSRTLSSLGRVPTMSYFMTDSTQAQDGLVVERDMPLGERSSVQNATAVYEDRYFSKAYGGYLST